MKLPISGALLGVCLILAIGGSPAIAQDSLRSEFAVDFAFKVAESSYPAGKYELTYRVGDRYLSLRNRDNGATKMVQFITRLSAREKGGVVFDKGNEGSFLTEIYLGRSDGFLIKGAEGDHEHVKVEPIP